MKELIERNYAATVKRGLINEDTDKIDFLLKIEEEFDEVYEEFFKSKIDQFDLQKYASELMDLAAVCINNVKHLGLDPIKEFEKVVIKNETRED